MSEEEFTVKVILTEDITPLGVMGTVVEVARGYARNYLIPQGKAMEVTPGNLAQVEQAKVKYAQKRAKDRETAVAQVERLDGVSLTIAQRVGEEERLYGSVTAAMIAAALESRDFQVDKKQVELPEPIKKLGVYEITIRLAPDVKATVTVEVVPESA
jgi:large subunit ribosomal protein L9